MNTYTLNTIFIYLDTTKQLSDIRLKFQVYMHSLLEFHYQYAQCNKIQMIS